jgi:FKBP-type peptidyl-prolyl cis-trans isomerase FkpA
MCGCLLVAGCKGKTEEASTTAPAPATTVSTTKDKVEITDVKVGEGKPVAAPGDTVWVAYTATLKDGTPVETNDSPDKDPYVFTLGQHAVIQGWDDGIKGMRVGGVRKLVIPPSLGYGANAQAKVPANSVLLYDVKLLGLVKAGEENVIDLVDIKKGTGDRVVKRGDNVVLQYVGALTNGRVFDDSHKTKEPYGFRVGAEQTLSCIDKGVQGMKVGGIRKIIAPPATAFAGKMNTKVPYNSEVIFTIELVSLK